MEPEYQRKFVQKSDELCSAVSRIVKELGFVSKSLTIVEEAWKVDRVIWKPVQVILGAGKRSSRS